MKPAEQTSPVTKRKRQSSDDDDTSTHQANGTPGGAGSNSKLMRGASFISSPGSGPAEFKTPTGSLGLGTPFGSALTLSPTSSSPLRSTNVDGAPVGMAGCMPTGPGGVPLPLSPSGMSPSLMSPTSSMGLSVTSPFAGRFATSPTDIGMSSRGIGSSPTKFNIDVSTMGESAEHVDIRDADCGRVIGQRGAMLNKIKSATSCSVVVKQREHREIPRRCTISGGNVEGRLKESSRYANLVVWYCKVDWAQHPGTGLLVKSGGQLLAPGIFNDKPISENDFVSIAGSEPIFNFGPAPRRPLRSSQTKWSSPLKPCGDYQAPRDGFWPADQGGQSGAHPLTDVEKGTARPGGPHSSFVVTLWFKNEDLENLVKAVFHISKQTSANIEVDRSVDNPLRYVRIYAKKVSSVERAKHMTLAMLSYCESDGVILKTDAISPVCNGDATSHPAPLANNSAGSNGSPDSAPLVASTSPLDSNFAAVTQMNPAAGIFVANCSAGTGGMKNMQSAGMEYSVPIGMAGLQREASSSSSSSSSSGSADSHVIVQHAEVIKMPPGNASHAMSAGAPEIDFDDI